MVIINSCIDSGCEFRSKGIDNKVLYIIKYISNKGLKVTWIRDCMDLIRTDFNYEVRSLFVRLGYQVDGIGSGIGSGIKLAPYLYVLGIEQYITQGNGSGCGDVVYVKDK